MKISLFSLAYFYEKIALLGKWERENCYEKIDMAKVAVRVTSDCLRLNFVHRYCIRIEAQIFVN